MFGLEGGIERARWIRDVLSWCYIFSVASWPLFVWDFAMVRRMCGMFKFTWSCVPRDVISLTICGRKREDTVQLLDAKNAYQSWEATYPSLTGVL
jgi:hypothetical protein